MAVIQSVFSMMICYFADSTMLDKRQTLPTAIDEYMTGVKTAIFVIDCLKSGNESTSCADFDIVSELNGGGYDGQYAQRLLFVSTENFL